MAIATANQKATVGTAANYGTVANGGTISDSLLYSSVADILGLQSSSTLDTANAKAQTATISGYDAETKAYGQASDIAVSNAGIAGAAGAVKGVQEAQKLALSVGTAKAAIGGAGFKESGSNLDILASSLQQGALEQQLNETQTNLNVAGYLAESVADKAQAAGTTAASDSAKALGDYYTSAAADYTAKAGSLTSLLNSYLGGSKLTSAEGLILSPVSSGLTNVPSGSNLTDLVTGGGTTSTTGTVTNVKKGTGFDPTGKVKTSVDLVGVPLASNVFPFSNVDL